ncbi:MAG: hypothetical protein GY861_24130 [bacterium]|nr:hypothetical protein [bacterium]
MFCGWELFGDWAVLAQLKSGTITINALDGGCTHNGELIPQMSMARVLGKWLRTDFEANNIPLNGIREALLTVDFQTEEIPEQRNKSVIWRDPTPPFIACQLKCQSRIVTDEKLYESKYDKYEEWPKSMTNIDEDSSNTKTMGTLDLFKDLTGAFLEAYCQIEYEWVDREGITGVRIHKQEENGFNVFWGSDGREIYFEAGDIHHSAITLEDQNSPDKEIRHHIGFLRDLLSNRMRIVEKYAGKTPYKVLVQTWNDKQWQTEDIFGSVFYNYFAKKSEITYQNNILEGKEIHNNSQ